MLGQRKNARSAFKKCYINYRFRCFVGYLGLFIKLDSKIINILYICTALLFVARLAHAQRSKLVDFVGIALIAYIAFKVNLVLLILPVIGTTRPPAVSLAQLGPHCVGRRPPGTRLPGTRPLAGSIRPAG